MSGWRDEIAKGWRDARWMIRFALWLLPCVTVACALSWLLGDRFTDTEPPGIVGQTLVAAAGLVALLLARPWK